MPVIARFYRIVIKMYVSQIEQDVPHFHAVYGEYNGVFSIEPLGMLEGDLPVRAQRLVEDWACKHKDALLDIWRNQTFRQVPGLE